MASNSYDYSAYSYNGYTYPVKWQDNSSWSGWAVDQSGYMQPLYGPPVAQIAAPKVEAKVVPKVEDKPESELVQWLRGRVGEITELAWV